MLDVSHNEAGIRVLSTHNHSRKGRPDRVGGRRHMKLVLWRRRAATLVAAVLALLMAYGVVFGHNGLTAFAAKRRDSRSLLLQMQQLERENSRLQGHVDRLQNDPSAIEHQAREELHYTRAGEVIYTLPASEVDKAQGTSQR